MDKILEEKRSYPRIRTNLKIGISGGICADSVDLSEGGVSFYSEGNIFSPLISLEIFSPDREFEFKTDARLVWKNALTDRGGYLYGVEFKDINESGRLSLRQGVIKAQTSQLLAGIDDGVTKEEVSDFFLEDVSKYMSNIRDIAICLSEEEGYSIDLEEELERLNTQILLKGYCLEQLLSDKITIQKVKSNFRKLVGPLIYKSAILKRGFEQPRGVPEDYRILEIIYDNKPVSKNIGLYFDSYFLKCSYAVALRNRKDHFKKLLQGYIEEIKSNRINILDIDCGSCRQIRELLPDLKTQNSVIFNCIDGDEEALAFSQDSLSGISAKNIEFSFSKKSVTDMINDENFVLRSAKQNLIYSMGLIDYLPDDVLKKLVQVLYQILQVSGKLILTHKNSEKTFPALPPDWLCDWQFAPRNREELIHLFYTSGISGFLFNWEADNFGYIYYFTITKK